MSAIQFIVEGGQRLAGSIRAAGNKNAALPIVAAALITDQPVEQYLAEIVQRVRKGELDDALVYRKNLRKGTEEYTATTPPHVAAARKSAQASGRLISYIMTTAGPEPIDNVQHPLDREHYVDKQVRPVAEPVLATLGLDFERAIGDSRQLDLLS